MRTLGNWERGESIPRNRLARLEEVLGVPLRDRAPGGAAPARLQDLVQRRMRELGMVQANGDLNIRELWRRGGGGDAGEWSYESVRQIVNDGHQNIEDRTAQTLAAALQIPLNEVLVLAGQRPRADPFVLPDRSAALTPEERRIMIDVMDGFLGAYAENRPEVPQQRGRRAGAPRFDLSTAEGLRLAELDSVEAEPANHTDDTQ